MERNNNEIDWGGWIFTIIMLGAFWPVGLVLLFRQLMGYSRRSGRVKKHPYDLQREQQARQSGYTPQGQYRYTAQPSQGSTVGQTAPQYAPPMQEAAKTAGTQSSAARGGWDTVKKSTVADRKTGKGKGNLLTLIGAGLSGVFGLATLLLLGDIIGYGFHSYQFQPLLLLTGFFGAGLVCLYTGHYKRKQAKRYKKYLAYIGRNQVVSLPALAAAMGVKEKTVYDDLQDMLDDGILPMGYIDVAAGELVLSDKGISNNFAQSVKAEPAPEPEPVKKTVEDENAILQEIREVNDAIPDEVMSAKIDRIGEITGKILDYQRSYPNKSGQLRSFLNYYLPTTLKILRAYARLDAQGIEGENITAAKKRIESMMDQVVDGFEKQLDKLFADDALDITSDVQVLENMLRKDGLSDGGMTLGGVPVAEEGGFSPQQSYLDLQKVADELDAQTRDKNDGQITLQL